MNKGNGLVTPPLIYAFTAGKFKLFVKPVNTLRLRQNGCHFADNIFKCIFLTENVWISINISLKFVPKVQINNIPALVQIMAWRRPGDKPLSEPMMLSLLTHICVTGPQWVNFDCLSNRSAIGMLMPWLLVSPGHQHPWLQVSLFFVFLEGKFRQHISNLSQGMITNDAIIKNRIFFFKKSST